MFDVYPAERRVQARATVTFRMRPGQSRPIVHFEPARSPSGVALRLDGQDLDLARASRRSPLLLPGIGPGLARAAERPRPGRAAPAGGELPAALSRDAGGRFFANVNDIEGRGNESSFPTLNTPHELAHHVLVFRVHAAEPYLAVGSGLVTARAAR